MQLNSSFVAEALQEEAAKLTALSIVHTSLQNASEWANETGRTWLELLLKEADGALLFGPDGGWGAILDDLKATVKAYHAQLQPIASALKTFTDLANDAIFSVRVGSQTTPLNGFSALALAAFGFIALATALATASHVGLLTHLEDTLKDAFNRHGALQTRKPPAAVAPLTETLVSSSTSDDLAADQGGACTTDEDLHGSEPPKRSPQSSQKPRGWQAVLRCFSLPRNWTSLGCLRDGGSFGCLDGMRCFSMAWVIYGHTVVFAVTPGGTQYLAELLPKGQQFAPGIAVPPDGGKISGWLYQLLPAAFFAVDTFFWMGGLLTAIALSKQMSKLGSRWFKFYPIYVLTRWLRLTPVVVVALLWTTGLAEQVGDGPLWGFQSDAHACKESWWTVIFYVQNLVLKFDSSEPSCLGHLWYLSNDMQFYLVAPLIVFPMVAKPLLGWSLWALATLGSTAANLAISYSGSYTASPLFDQLYFADIYVQPWCRIQPYLIGIGLGVIWQQTSWPSASPGRASLCWSLCLAAALVMLADVFGTHGLYAASPSPWSQAKNVSYITLSRLAWALGLSALSYVCAVGEAPNISIFLSWWPFQVYGKLCYCAYIFHPLIMNAINYASSEYVEYSDTWFASQFTAFLVWASALGVCVYLLVEKPTANLIPLALSALGMGSPRSGE